MRRDQFTESGQDVWGHTFCRVFVTQGYLQSFHSLVDTDLLPLYINMLMKRKCRWKQPEVTVCFVYQIGNNLKRYSSLGKVRVWRSLHSLPLLVGVSVGMIFLEGNLAICMKSHILWHSISTSRNLSERTNLASTHIYKDV